MADASSFCMVTERFFHMQDISYNLKIRVRCSEHSIYIVCSVSEGTTDLMLEVLWTNCFSCYDFARVIYIWHCNITVMFYTTVSACLHRANVITALGSSFVSVVLEVSFWHVVLILFGGCDLFWTFRSFSRFFLATMLPPIASRWGWEKKKRRLLAKTYFFWCSKFDNIDNVVALKLV